MIQSVQNKLVKTINLLKTAKGRKSEGLYLLEGVKPVAESIAMGKSLEVIVCAELLKNHAIPQHNSVIEVSEQVFRHLTTLENPEGILSINAINRNAINQLAKKPFLVLCGVQDPGNTGTLIRSADAFGFSQVVFLEGNADPFGSKTTRSSMGSILRINAFFGESQELISLIKTWQCPLIGLDINGVQDNQVKVDLDGAYGVVVGSESHGISPEIIQILTQKIRIPMTESIESLNAAVAGSIIMHNLYSRKIL
jgi:TrmH family RNA methyltransferase